MQRNNKQLSFFLATGALIAAVYAAFTYLAGLLGLAYGPIQFRLSEALTVLAAVTPAAIPGLTVGCFLGNLGSPYGIVDVLCGTLATLLAALLSYAVRRVRWKGLPLLAPAAPVLCNALVVGCEVACLSAEGFSVAGFALAAFQVGLGELVVCYGLGLPFCALLTHTRLDRLLNGKMA